MYTDLNWKISFKPTLFISPKYLFNQFPMVYNSHSFPLLAEETGTAGKEEGCKSEVQQDETIYPQL